MIQCRRWRKICAIKSHSSLRPLKNLRKDFPYFVSQPPTQTAEGMWLYASIFGGSEATGPFLGGEVEPGRCLQTAH